MPPYAAWLHLLALFYLALCACSALFIAVDILRGHRQKMWIMHIVWPITAMYFGPVAIWIYLRTRPVSLAYILGIVFQYFTIAPMRGLSLGKGIKAAVRADTISIAAFEVGMFAWMALTRFVLFPASRIHPNMAVFWFMMQIAMMIGWATSYPANIWLIRRGWKEKMPMYPSKQVMQQHEIPRAA